MRRIAFGALLAAACSTRMAPRWAEALVVVDTDLPAPAIVSDVRIDFFREDGTWFESRDLPAPDAASWPLSFSVFAHDESRDTHVVLRIRGYPVGREQDYHGPPIDPSSGIATPATEPLARLSIDRLVLLRLVPGTIGRAIVTLHGSCAGVTSKLAESKTCIDGTLEAANETALEPTSDVPSTTAIGTYGASPACDSPGTDDVACVSSGAFLFGGPRRGNVNVTSTMPDRIVRTSRFFIDRQEVSVKRYRAALADGLPHPTAVQLRTTHALKNTDACSFDDMIGATNEELALNCIGWDDARAFCQFRGGDLPSEVQWEHAATAGRAYKTRYPAGDTTPGCMDAIWGRAFSDDLGQLAISTDCNANAGPSPLRTDIDRSALGIFALAGSMAEWARDTGVDFGNDCWTNAPTLDPVCTIPGNSLRAIRGGSWLQPASQLDAIARDIKSANEEQNSYIGFRCVYANVPAVWK